MAVQVLPDGSFLSVMPTPAENVRYGQARAAGANGPPSTPSRRAVPQREMALPTPDWAGQA